MALAVLAAAGLYFLIPEDFVIAEESRIVYPALLVLLLALLIVGDPGRIDRQRRWLRTATGLLIAIMAAGIGVSAVRLVVGILHNAHFTAPTQLLSIGAAIWSTNVITFALAYWHLDSGGPVARARGTGPGRPAFRFPEHDIDELMQSGWYPQFVDYLALSFNTATAFSAADVSPVRHWSKLCLIAESAISLVVVALVVARAVNIL
jgi:uncharacterized membrane protein